MKPTKPIKEETLLLLEAILRDLELDPYTNLEERANQAMALAMVNHAGVFIPTIKKFVASVWGGSPQTDLLTAHVLQGGYGGMSGFHRLPLSRKYRSEKFNRAVDRVLVNPNAVFQQDTGYTGAETHLV